MNRPDVLLLILPILLVLAWHSRLIHRYGWQSELREEEPRREPSYGPAHGAAAVASGLTSEGPRPSSSQSPGCYYAPVTLAEIDAWEDTFDRWRAREKAARP